MVLKIENEIANAYIEKFETESVAHNKQLSAVINIAIIDFTAKDVSASESSVVSDFLRIELVNTGVYNVIEKTNMDKILAEVTFQQIGCTTTECAVEMGKILNVKQMVVGSFSRLMDAYFITASLVDVETGQILKSSDVQVNTALEVRSGCKVLAKKLLP